jgi:hypothetical protein
VTFCWRERSGGKALAVHGGWPHFRSSVELDFALAFDFAFALEVLQEYFQQCILSSCAVAMRKQFQTTATRLTYKDGKYGVVPWIYDGTSLKCHWSGPLPEGTFAQAHAHPTSVSEKPGYDDHDLADGKQDVHLSVPVLVLHQRGINEAVPHQSQPVQLMDNHWIDLFKPKK